MAQPILKTTLQKASLNINKLSHYLVLANHLQAKHQYFIAEVVMLRLFSILESTIGELSLKLGCGALYLNGASPKILNGPFKSLQAAEYAMLSVGRKKRLIYLKWTKANLIQDSVRFVLDPHDHFMTNVHAHGALINEMRVIRNHIAHRTKSTSIDYRSLLLNKYGANPKITIGAYLLSTKRHSRNNITQYLLSTSIILNSLAQGY